MFRRLGCGGLLTYIVVLGMLIVPVVCLVSTIQVAPTPEHRAAVEAMPPDPVADWAVTGLAIAVPVVLVIMALSNGKQQPIVEHIAEPLDSDPLWLAAHTNMVTSLPMHEIRGGRLTWQRPGWKESK